MTLRMTPFVDHLDDLEENDEDDRNTGGEELTATESTNFFHNSHQFALIKEKKMWSRRG